MPMNAGTREEGAARIRNTTDLATFVGNPDPDGFWRGLFDALQKADPQQLGQLRAAFPIAVAAWETWRKIANASHDPTFAELHDALNQPAE